MVAPQNRSIDQMTISQHDLNLKRIMRQALAIVSEIEGIP